MNLRLLGGTLALSLLVGAGVAADTTGAARAQTVPQTWIRGERASAHDLVFVRRRLEALIDQLQRDQRDYGGHRVQAIEAMQQARADIVQALQYDASHPGR